MECDPFAARIHPSSSCLQAGRKSRGCRFQGVQRFLPPSCRQALANGKTWDELKPYPWIAKQLQMAQPLGLPTPGRSL